MSRESAIRFLRGLRTNKGALELLKGKVKAGEDAADAYAEVAAELGEDVSPSDVAGALEEVEAGMRRRAQAASDRVVELDDSDLERIAGGDEDWCPPHRGWPAFLPH